MTKKHQESEECREIKIQYGESVAVLPLAAVDAIGRASGLYCKVLILLSADPALRVGSASALRALARRAGCDVETVRDAISYFCGAGVLARGEIAPVQTVEEAPADSAPQPMKPAESVPQKLEKADEFPHYSISEITDLLEKRRNLSLFVDECQRAYGKMFNPRDINVILGMVEYLSLSEEYVLILLRYFGSLPEESRKSLHYVERMAISLANEGVTEPDALIAHLERVRLLSDHQNEIREIFGMGSRALTAKEKKLIMTWLGEYQASPDLIRLAYERTVHATGKASVAYASKILERWHGEGWKTPAEVEAAESSATSLGDNFETNDFFEAALRRSYGDAYESEKKGGN